MTTNKLQYELISNLLQKGQVELLLPDGIKLEIGITQVDINNDLVKTDDYCWLIASRQGKSVVLDSYNLGLRYPNDNSSILYQDELTTAEGDSIKLVDVV